MFLRSHARKRALEAAEASPAPPLKRPRVAASKASPRRDLGQHLVSHGRLSAGMANRVTRWLDDLPAEDPQERPASTLLRGQSFPSTYVPSEPYYCASSIATPAHRRFQVPKIDWRGLLGKCNPYGDYYYPYDWERHITALEENSRL